MSYSDSTHDCGLSDSQVALSKTSAFFLSFLSISTKFLNCFAPGVPVLESRKNCETGLLLNDKEQNLSSAVVRKLGEQFDHRSSLQIMVCTLSPFNITDLRDLFQGKCTPSSQDIRILPLDQHHRYNIIIWGGVAADYGFSKFPRVILSLPAGFSTNASILPYIALKCSISCEGRRWASYGTEGGWSQGETDPSCIYFHQNMKGILQ
jgi:hypothetical protein